MWPTGLPDRLKHKAKQIFSFVVRFHSGVGMSQPPSGPWPPQSGGTPPAANSPNTNAPLPNQPILPNQPNIPAARPAQPAAQPVPTYPQPNQPATPANAPPANQTLRPQSAPTNPNQPLRPGQPIPQQHAPQQPAPAQPNRPLRPGDVPAAAPPSPPAQKSAPQPATPKPAPANRSLAANMAPPAPQPTSIPQSPAPETVPQKVVREDDPDEHEDDPAKVAARSAPPWLLSLGIHAALLIIIALISIPQFVQKTVVLDVTYAEEIGEQLIDPDLDFGDELNDLEIVEPVLSEDFTPVEDPFAAPPNIEPMFLNDVSAVSMLEAPSIGKALDGREKGAKAALLAAYGGNASTEASVKKGLEWLKRNQRKDGMWSLTGPYDTIPGTLENEVAATAMALLAFQGAGHTHKVGEFKSVVAKGWDALLKNQDSEGNFFRPGPPPHHRLYTHAQATIALCELYGMTKDAKYRKPAQLALNYSVSAQSPVGGWRYTPTQDADLSVTGWFMMAMQSGRMAGLDVPSDTLDKITNFLDSVQAEEGAKYMYKPRDGVKPSMTAEGLLCRQYLGWKHDDPRLATGCDYLLLPENGIDWDLPNAYHWYYATQTLHHMGGDRWDQWNAVMRQSLPEQQVSSGNERGSWNPGGDQWASHGGRLYMTCFCVYMLEVYYRHLPIYKH